MTSKSVSQQLNRGKGMNYDIRWKDEPELVWVQCDKVKPDIQPFQALNEVVVSFKINGGKYTAFVPKEFVDLEKRRIAATIVADYGNDYLVDLPVETLTSGPRILVPESEKGNLVIV